MFTHGLREIGSIVNLTKSDPDSIDCLPTDWVSGNEEMMTNDDNLESTSTLLN